MFECLERAPLDRIRPAAIRCQNWNAFGIVLGFHSHVIIITRSEILPGDFYLVIERPSRRVENWEQVCSSKNFNGLEHLQSGACHGIFIVSMYMRNRYGGGVDKRTGYFYFRCATRTVMEYREYGSGILA